MRSMISTSLLIICLTPSTCWAFAFSVEGNEPQSPANYQRWDGLADLVNQPTRQHLFWCNGSETLSYEGDTAALNQALRVFAQIDCSAHTVVFRPRVPKDKHDWHLNIVEGITRHAYEAWGLADVHFMDPTLVVYVSNRIQLDDVVLPPGVTATQLRDLRQRYNQALTSGTEQAQRAAKRLLEGLDQNAGESPAGRNQYQQRISQIAKFVEQTTAARLSKE